MAVLSAFQSGQAVGRQINILRRRVSAFQFGKAVGRQINVSSASERIFVRSSSCQINSLCPAGETAACATALQYFQY
jgi:hypothetical protein